MASDGIKGAVKAGVDGASGRSASGKVAGGQLSGAALGVATHIGKSKKGQAGLLALLAAPIAVVVTLQLILLTSLSGSMGHQKSGKETNAAREVVAAGTADRADIGTYREKASRSGVAWEVPAAMHYVAQNPGATSPTVGGACNPNPPEGADPDAPAWVHPINSSSFTLTSPFGMRYHPVDGTYKMHNGQDFGAPGGTPLVSPGYGTVAQVLNGDPGGGNMIWLEMAGGDVVVYMHMQAPTPLSVGDPVQPMTLVGYVGTTGSSTGDHLHFGLKPGGIDNSYSDPIPWLEARGVDPATGSVGEATLPPCEPSGSGPEPEAEPSASAGPAVPAYPGAAAPAEPTDPTDPPETSEDSDWVGPYKISREELGDDAGKADDLAWSTEWVSRKVAEAMANADSDHSRGSNLDAGLVSSPDEGTHIDPDSAAAQDVEDAYVAAIQELPIKDMDEAMAQRIFDTAIAWHVGDEAPAAAGGGFGSGAVCDPAPGTALSVTNGVETFTMSETQLGYAATMHQKAKELGASDDAQVIMYMTALAESRFVMYANSNVPESLSYPHDAVGSDHLSVNHFQQQPWWGPSIAKLMDVSYSAKAFLTGYESVPGLFDVPGWKTMPKGVAAQSVQVSAFPDAYAAWENAAASILGKAKGIPCTSGGWNGEKTGNAIVDAALTQVGVPYSWGGGNQDGPTLGIGTGAGTVGFDCSGLTQYAYWQGAKTMTGGFTGTDWNHISAAGNMKSSISQLEVGDMIFFHMSGGVPGHVGIWMGNGQMVHAPRTGLNVSVTTVVGNSYWESGFIGGGHY